MGWYKRLRPPRSRAERERVAFKSKRPIPQRVRKPPRIRDPDHIFYQTYSTKFWIDGYCAKVITRYGIAKFFGVEHTTVWKWGELGVLPEPFVEQDRGGTAVPLYLSAQIRCLMVVMRDLVADGYTSIQWRGLPDHMEMLYDGYDEAMAKFKKRMMGDTCKEEGSYRGVTFLDDD